jgi:hypothetical protein
MSFIISRTIVFKEELDMLDPHIHFGREQQLDQGRVVGKRPGTSTTVMMLRQHLFCFDTMEGGPCEYAADVIT